MSVQRYLSSYDLYVYGKGSCVNRKGVEIARAKVFERAIVKYGEDPGNYPGVWEALTNNPRCGGLKSKHAKMICHRAMRKAGWGFTLSLGRVDPNNDSTIPSAWGMGPMKGSDANVVGYTMNAAAAELGGWVVYWGANWL